MNRELLYSILRVVSSQSFLAGATLVLLAAEAIYGSTLAAIILGVAALLFLYDAAREEMENS